MIKDWWKILGVFLVLYSLLAGMLVPLGPGLTGVDPMDFHPGQTAELQITGYNTLFKDKENELKVVLHNQGQAIAAQEIKVHDNNRLMAKFGFPGGFPGDPGLVQFSLIIDQAGHGTAVLPGAVGVTYDSISREGWQDLSAFNLTRKGFHFPYRNILVETIRNIYYHVTMWFAMMILLLISCIYSVRHLLKPNVLWDNKAQAYATVGVLFGVLGTITGMFWANATWGKPWNWDIKQTMVVVALLIYLAYFVLRSSIEDKDKRYRVAAAYNIFSFATLVPLLFIIPRMVDSLHPGSGGNPALGGEDLDNTMRLVFYPAIIGWIFMGAWIAQLITRTRKIEEELREGAMTN